MPSQAENNIRKGLGVTHHTSVEAKSAIMGRIDTTEPVHVITLTPEMCVRAYEDPEFRKIIDSAGIVVADGVGVAWGESRLTGRKTEKAPGIDLADIILNYLAKTCGSVFLLGGKPDIARQAVGNLLIRYPSIVTSGWQDGYFDMSEEEHVVERIAQTKSNVLLVGMGSPKQEIFIAKHLDKLNCGLAVGIGGTFDVWSGKVRRAPAIFRNTGLEWLYRTSTQPFSRAGRLRKLMRFTFLVLSGRIKQAKN